MGRKRLAVALGVRAMAAFVLVLAAAAPARAQRGMDEYEVKAAFLYNFVKFVQWPPSDQRSGVIRIGVLGHVPRLTVALETMTRGRPANGSPIVVKEMSPSDDPREFHIVFVPDSEAARAALVLERARGAAVLTVGESPDFLKDGGIARFFVEANRVRFQIDAAGAQQEGLKVSSQLLSLAK
jgi:hypothetical protein